jgi:hypothetical protein
MDIGKRLFDSLSSLDSIRSRHFHIHDDEHEERGERPFQWLRPRLRPHR